MKLILLLCFLTLWSSGFCDEEAEKESPKESEGSPMPQLGGMKDLVVNLVDSVMSGLSSLPILKKGNVPDCVVPPLECPNKNITFWYYRRSLKTSINLSVLNFTSIQNLQVNEYPWKVIITGYGKGKDDLPNPQIRSALFQNGEFNVISVDYLPIAGKDCYLQAVENIPLIANCTAQLLDALMDKRLFRPDNLHIIGYSLGAHIAGAIYEYSRHLKPHRISGLDPAATLVDGIVIQKLGKNSADFVDIIHTNALIKGKIEPLGHADFYVNGGIHQVGCGSGNAEAYSECSHERSALYFAESINSPTGFWGIPCESYMKFYAGFCDTVESKLVAMGENVLYGTRGTFYLETANKAPYALGKRSNVITVAQRMQT